jgi:leucyl-tRNA synthetase
VVEATREVPVQVNGKLRDRITVPAEAADADLEAAALASERVRGILAGRDPLRVVVAGGGRLVNVVVRDAE